jgi:hypothetical protein
MHSIILAILCCGNGNKWVSRYGATHFIWSINRIGGVMISGFTSSAEDRGFETRWGQTKDYKIGNCCFSAKHAALKRKSKDWLARNQNNVSEWSDMSTRRLLFPVPNFPISSTGWSLGPQNLGGLWQRCNNFFYTFIGLSHVCCHNVMYFLNNPSVIFLTQLQSISEYSKHPLIINAFIDID